MMIHIFYAWIAYINNFHLNEILKFKSQVEMGGGDMTYNPLVAIDEVKLKDNNQV
jgi:hypothetical protein